MIRPTDSGCDLEVADVLREDDASSESQQRSEMSAPNMFRFIEGTWIQSSSFVLVLLRTKGWLLIAFRVLEGQKRLYLVH